MIIWYRPQVHIMHICANQLWYGFNIFQKLETLPHENQNSIMLYDSKLTPILVIVSRDLKTSLIFDRNFIVKGISVKSRSLDGKEKPGKTNGKGGKIRNG